MIEWIGQMATNHMKHDPTGMMFALTASTVQANSICIQNAFINLFDLVGNRIIYLSSVHH